MTAKYQVWFRDPRKVIRNILANPDLVNDIDYIPYRDFEDGKRRYCDFMSGDWAWKQCVSDIHGKRLRLLTILRTGSHRYRR